MGRAGVQQNPFSDLAWGPGRDDAYREIPPERRHILKQHGRDWTSREPARFLKIKLA